MAKTLRNYKWFGYVVLFLAVLQIILIYKVSDDSDDNIDASSDVQDGEGQRNVYWLKNEQIDKNKVDFYSGSWLIPMSHFLSVKVDDMQTLEDATFTVNNVNEKKTRMSVDWLDFAVEHMSRWYKSLDVFNPNHNDVAINKITGNLMKYVEDTPERTKALLSTSDYYPLLHPTIAIISSAAIIPHHSYVPSRSKDLTATTLGATIASLLRAGIGRIVCTGIDEADEVAVRETYQLILEQYAERSDWIAATEFAYVQIDEELYKSKFVDVHRPKGTIKGLQKALRTDSAPPDIEKWLGNTNPPSYWKYVYFTEPDLVLQTRATSLPAIHKALEKGHMLMPHRLELTPHEIDLTKDNFVYNGIQRFLPARGKFTDILDLDGDEDMCCDGGKNRPRWNIKVIWKDAPTASVCADWWWNCGYWNDWVKLGLSDEVRHGRILMYAPFIRLTQGTDIIAFSGTEHERKCHPRKRHSPNDICERPSPSGRSFATSEEQDE